MNKEEMDIYLKSIGGLKCDWGKYERIIEDSRYFGVGEGWYPIIKDLIDDLIKLGWNKNIVHVKEKFGGLRFYIDKGSDEIHKRITQAEKDSYEICEKCGNKGELKKNNGWYLTLCEEHHILRLQKHNHE